MEKENPDYLLVCCHFNQFDLNGSKLSFCCLSDSRKNLLNI